MKKIIFAIVVLMLGTASYAITTPEVNEKVLKAFKETFKNPEEVIWYENTGGYQVHFKCEEVISKVWYDADGNILQTFRYYSESKLPPFVLGKLKKKFADKSIYGVTEISDESGVHYYIKLEDEKNWLTIKATPQGSLEVHEKFKKA